MVAEKQERKKRDGYLELSPEEYETIQELRINGGGTGRDIAKKIGIAFSTFYRLLRNERGTVITLYKVQKYLNKKKK